MHSGANSDCYGMHTSSFFVSVLFGQVPFLGACSKTDIPHKEWERCCLERTKHTGIERSTVIAGKLWFLCSHCLGSCKVNVKK